jgi:hypothetical protein
MTFPVGVFLGRGASAQSTRESCRPKRRSDTGHRLVTASWPRRTLITPSGFCAGRRDPFRPALFRRQHRGPASISAKSQPRRGNRRILRRALICRVSCSRQRRVVYPRGQVEGGAWETRNAPAEADDQTKLAAFPGPTGLEPLRRSAAIYSRGWRVTAAGSRPASNQPAVVATMGRATMITTRLKRGMLVSGSRSLRCQARRAA